MSGVYLLLMDASASVQETRVFTPNQKPLDIMRLIIEASSDPGDLVWEPFGGLCTAAIAAFQLKRRCVSAEINREFFELAVRRLQSA
jgi:DNA modification methylase